MAALTVPQTATGNNAQLGLNYIVASMIEMELADKLDAMTTGVASLMGDLAGSGSKVTRLRFAGGFGWDTRLQVMASETDTPAEASPTAGYTACTLGQYGLSVSESFMARITADAAARGVTGTEALRSGAVPSFLSTFRYNVCVTGATISTSVGSSAAKSSVDNYVAAIASFNTTAGAVDRGAPVFMAHLQQAQDIRDSARSEPAFQNAVAAFGDVQGVMGQVTPNFLGLKATMNATADVQTSGGAYQGFGISPGGIGYCVASTSPLDLGNATNVVYVDRYGLVIYDVLNESGQTVKKSQVIAFNGYALGDSSVFHQIRLLGQTS